jgi:glycosyltransferase involved in cell wall biosynthesis
MLRLAGELEARGHAVRISGGRGSRHTVWGRKVHRLSPKLLRSVQVIVTPGTRATLKARMAARKYRRLLVHCVHTAANLDTDIGNPRSLVVWGSAAFRERAREAGLVAKGPELVMWPVVRREELLVEPGTRVTLVNLSPEKGGHLWWELVRRMPDVPFLAVKGGWGDQCIPPRLPSNVEIMEYVQDPREVYRRTRLLLYMKAPDAGSNWLNGVGMTAVEGSVSGIPTVAHPGPGLQEYMGDAGVWVDSHDADEWEEAIRRSLEPDRWCWLSRKARERAELLDPDGDLDRFLDALHTLTEKRSP